MKQELIELYKTFKNEYPDGTEFSVTFEYEELPKVEYVVTMQEKENKDE